MIASNLDLYVVINKLVFVKPQEMQVVVRLSGWRAVKHLLNVRYCCSRPCFELDENGKGLKNNVSYSDGNDVEVDARAEFFVIMKNQNTKQAWIMSTKGTESKNKYMGERTQKADSEITDTWGLKKQTPWCEVSGRVALQWTEPVGASPEVSLGTAYWSWNDNKTDTSTTGCPSLAEQFYAC